MKRFDLRALLAANRDLPRAFSIENRGADTTLYVYDVIDSMWGVGAKEFAKALSGIPETNTLHLRVNSPGGDVFEARAMVTALRAFGGRKVAHIDGLAASAASYLALAADEVRIAPGAFLMVHQAWTLAMGNANDLVEVAALLEKIDGTIVDDYARKTGADREQIEAWMAAETWFTAEEAIEHKFADAIEEDAPIAAVARWDVVASMEGAPEALANQPVPKYVEMGVDMLERVSL
jgi:ATP-dependent Clp protease, protease subunit